MTLKHPFLLALLFILGACAESHPDVSELTIDHIQARFDSGELTAEQLVRIYMDRIERVDRAGPTLNSIIEINPDALAIARALDEERRESGARGPLHGIPVLLKANIDTGDRMATSAGSLALADHVAPDDAAHVSKLREAGAVILGKTNLSEWANFRSEHSSSGWSSIGGQTRNPYDTTRNPCGSSSGSGVAVAANLVSVAVGTETDGSVVCPASINGIVGIKPTLGLVSRSGIIPIAHSQDTAGPMARTVRDAALLLNALVGADPAAQYAEAEALIERDLRRLGGSLDYQVTPAVARITNPPTESTFARPTFEQAVMAAKEFIAAGDAFQIVLSQRLESEFTGDPFAVYRALRLINPSPFLFFVRDPEVSVIGSSPELMTRVRDGIAYSRPIAGTRPRGATPEADRALAEDLLAPLHDRLRHLQADNPVDDPAAE